MNRIAKIAVLSISIPIALIILIAGGGFVYFVATEKDEIITEGRAYGFEIGQTKSQAYDAAVALFEDGDMTGIDSPELYKIILPSVSRNGFDTLEPTDHWWMFCSKRQSFFDSIVLSFDDSILVEIRRHCCYELP